MAFPSFPSFLRFRRSEPAATVRRSRLTTVAGERTAVGTGQSSADVIKSLTAANSQLSHALELEAYHQIRKALPIVESAFKNRRILEGEAIFMSDDPKLAEMLNEMAADVPFGYLGESATFRGLYQFMSALSTAADEYGLSGYEMIVDESGRQFERLLVPSPKNIEIEMDRGSRQQFIYYRDRLGAKRVRVDDLPTWGFLAFTHTTDEIWPPPLCWSLMSNAEVQMRALRAAAIQWWRYGDPALLFTIEFDKDASSDTIEVLTDEVIDGERQVAEVSKTLYQLMGAVDGAMHSRKQGKSADAYASAHGGTYDVKTVGDVDATLARYFVDHVQYHDSHVVALSQTPSWMYPQLTRSDGMNSNRSQMEAVVSSVAAVRRQKERNRVIRRIMDLLLVLQGDARYVGKYWIETESASIIDAKAEADAAKTEAEAEAILLDNIMTQFDENGKRLFKGDALTYYEQNTTAS